MSTNGVILYEGPSLIDGQPIVVIATGLASRSDNTKTGAMIQTWIIRSDVAPIDAIHTGQDSSVCGSCPLRGELVNGRNVNRSCYVTIWQAPRSVYDGYTRGIYSKVTPKQAQALFEGKRVRLGSYGNPSAAPLPMWRVATRLAAGRTGYIHNWQSAPRGWSDLVMASVDASDAAAAQAKGYRTFRVRTAAEALQAREIACPASAEAGKKTNCAACLACGGNGARAKVNIAIVAHGAGASHVARAA